ncbi:MAG TPA: response regulator transcription factor [Thermoleophilaceae bacterium]|jgi:DNA-binding NarL/FixJ family response regulator|nr:response regulator transcription factor [Thermoleophilaceae bacterium]
MILVICTHIRLYREALTELLGREPDFAVGGAAATAAECVDAVGDCCADMVLVDWDAPDAMDALRRLRQLSEPPRVVALGLPEEEDALLSYAEAGVSAYVTREDTLVELTATIRAAANGDLRCSSRTAGILMRRVAKLAAEVNSHTRAAQPVHLTRRELEIAALMDAGLPNKQIAQRLQIELPTVKNHVHHILEKLEVNGRGEAAAVLRSRGLIA